MAVSFAGGYASPMLRKAVFDRLHPGAEVTYRLVPIDEAYPDGHYDGKGDPTEAIVCTIICPDGWWIEGVKEVDRQEQGKDKNWRPVEMTAEQYTADCTKALGRAMRDAGIPQKVDELMVLMRWITALDGKAAPTRASVDHSTGEIISGTADPDDVDGADAGSNAEPTLEEQTAEVVQKLSGADKAKLARIAKEELGVKNLMRSGDQAAAVLKLIGQLNADADPGDEDQ